MMPFFPFFNVLTAPAVKNKYSSTLSKFSSTTSSLNPSNTKDPKLLIYSQKMFPGNCNSNPPTDQCPMYSYPPSKCGSFMLSKIKSGSSCMGAYKLKGGSASPTTYQSVGSHLTEESSFADPAAGEDDMLVYFQNLRSWQKRCSEVEQLCSLRHVDLMVLLETFRKVEYRHFDYRCNANLFTRPDLRGRPSSGMFVGSHSPIYKVRNPVGDLLYYKVNNIWFIVVYWSKNTKILPRAHQAALDSRAVDQAAAIDDDSDIDSVVEPESDQAAHRAQLAAGRARILSTIRNLFLTQNQIVLMGDWNEYKDSIVPFMEDLRATRLDTAASYSALANPDIHHFNDLIFAKGVELELVEQISRGTATHSDHDGILFKLKNCSQKKGTLKFFPKKLKEDAQLLARWKQMVQEFNVPNYLGRNFGATSVYEAIHFACGQTSTKHNNYIYKKRADYTAEQYAEIRRQNDLLYAAFGAERKRLARRLGNYKYRCRKDNWRSYIRETIRGQQHWRLFRAMDRNNTILAKRKVEDNILASRTAYVQRWVDELTTIYSQKELQPLPPEFADLNNIDLDEKFESAEELIITQEEIRRALSKTKKTTSAGPNKICYRLLSYFFDADPEFMTEAVNYEVNSTESPSEFKTCRFVPIFKNKPGNDKSNSRHYRLISIMDCFQKVVESVVVNKLADQLEQKAGDFQHGFIRKRGCHTALDHYFKYSRVFQERKSMMHVAFLDIEKAYPSVDHERMVQLCILKIGNYRYFHKMRQLQHTTALLDLGFALVPINISAGLKEGSKQSCLFFDLVIAYVVEAVDLRHHLGLSRDITHFLTAIVCRIIAYADDLTIMCESKRQLELVISSLIHFTAFFGLKVNAGKSNFLVNNYSDRQPDLDALSVQQGEELLAIPYTEKTLFLGYGIKANSDLSVTRHLEIRDELREKDKYFLKLRRLRYVFKGDVAIIRDLINQFYVARFYYGVNKMLTSLSEFQDFFRGLTADNWLHRIEPPFVRKLNQDIATAAGKIAPGNALNYLCAAVLCLKPIHVKHVQELRKEDIRDFWLAKSTSRCKQFILRNWENICTILKERNVVYTGRRHFLSACYGHVSLSMKYGGYENTICDYCDHQFNVPNALSNASIDCYCCLPLIVGTAPGKRVWTEDNRQFVQSVGKLLQTCYYWGWSDRDY